MKKYTALIILCSLVIPTVIAISVPSPPTGLQASTQFTIHLTWGIPTTIGDKPLSGYVIYGGINGSMLKYIASISSNQIRYYDDTEIYHPHTSYNYQVYAMNTGGYLSPPAAITVQTP
jgi:hypothetical protein